MICLAALLIFCLIEREVRQALTDRGTTKVNGLHAGRPATQPASSSWPRWPASGLIPGSGQSPPTIPQPTELQLHLLDLLDIDPRDLR